MNSLPPPLRAHLATACLALCAHAPASAQLAVVAPLSDALNVSNQAETIAKWGEQIAAMKQQYDQLKWQYAAVTGSYGRGQIGLNDSINASSVVPGTWQEVVQQQAQGTYGAKLGQYEQLIRTMPQELFQNPQGQSATTYRLSTDSVRAAMSGGDALYAQVQTHLNNLAKLSLQVDSTSNVKDAQDLQNRIATENGMLQSAMGKLNVMNLNLQANTLNQQNQAQAATQRFFSSSN